MRIAGSRLVRAPASEVWAFLLSPDRLRRCLPGCERFEPTGPDRYEATLRLGVAFLKGTYTGSLHVLEQELPSRLVLAAEGGGSLGSLSATGTLRFVEVGGATRLDYDGEAFVGGRIAALGERAIGATADRLIRLFFACVASHVEP